MDAPDAPVELDRRLEELQSLALSLGDEVSAHRTARLRAAIAELCAQQPVVLPAQRASLAGH